MNNFDFSNNTRIIFGKGVEKQVGKYAQPYGKKILLVHYGDGVVKSSGLYDKLVDSLKQDGFEITELYDIEVNPEIEKVREGCQLCREKEIDMILALGGGSIIDTAKAISVGAGYEGDVWDFFIGKAVINEATSILPVGVVLTLPATGSESSSAAILTNKDGKLKRDITHEGIRPTFALMNPEITFTLPAFQTAAGGVDIISHVLERYWTLESDVDFSDRLCEATIKSVLKNLPITLADPSNYAARAEIMWAGTVAHNGILGAGRTEDWGTHMIAHEISGMYGTTHGATLSIITPQWMTYVYQEDIPRFARFATQVWGIEPNFNDLEGVALKGIEATKAFYQKVGLPTSFTQANIPTDQFKIMAEKCTMNGPVGNFKQLNTEDVLKIYEMSS